MPELPDVEGFRRVAAEHAVGLRIAAVRVHDAQSVQRARPDEFTELLTGRYVVEVRRHGKWLVLSTAGSRTASPRFPCLLVHFGMTGMFVWCEPGEDTHRHDRIVLSLGSGKTGRGDLRYRDMRKLTGIHVARAQSDVEEVLGELGPDAAGVSRAEFRARLTTTRRRLKAALMDQSTVAGLGNLCVDEILWRAMLHPRRTSADLDAHDLAVLHQRMRSVLRSSMRAGRVPDRRSWLTGHRDEPDGQCPRCGTRLRRATVAGRSTVWCPSCQAS